MLQISFGPRAVRNEMKNIMRFWLDKGASGFRIDMAFSLIKNDKNFKENILLWQQVRRMLDSEYPNAVMISEWGDPLYAIKSGFHADLLLNFGDRDDTFRRFVGNRILYDKKNQDYFGVLDGQKSFSLEKAMQRFMDVYKKTRSKGLLSPSTGSHDVARISDGRSQSALKLIYTWLLTMPVAPFIYYGDEIGMKYFNLNSKEGGYERTGSRTPMQWDKSKNCGFSKAAKKSLYLPVDESKNKPTVSKQIDSKKSLLSFVRKLITLRLENPALDTDGSMKVLFCRDNSALVYLRQKKNNKILVALNPYSKNSRLEFTSNIKIKSVDIILGKKCKFKSDKNSISLEIPPKSFSIIKLS